MGILSPEHLIPLALLVIAATTLCMAARLAPGRWTGVVAAIIAVAIVITTLSWQPYVLVNKSWSAALSLPVQLCDVGGFVAAAALLWRRAVLVELAYFWGLGGTVQALLTPDLPQHFPSYPYFQYYIAHGGVVAAALVLVVGLRIFPEHLARVIGFTIGYTALVGLIDAVTGANYMYLRAKPPTPTLLDVLGPWPVYILAATAIALGLFALLDAPFRFRRGGFRTAPTTPPR